MVWTKDSIKKKLPAHDIETRTSKYNSQEYSIQGQSMALIGDQLAASTAQVCSSLFGHDGDIGVRS